jgi:hypothetical protein
MFTGVFKHKISILKLHGSIDTYKYEIAEEKGSFANLSGVFLYFKTNDFYDKQRPYRYDPETGKKVQSFHWSIDPNYITGTKKQEIISQPGMYKTLYEESEKRLMDCKTILIIGYSFGDAHVNKLIQKAIDASKALKTLVNVNPTNNFNFITKGIKVHHLTDIQELVSIPNG